MHTIFHTTLIDQNCPKDKDENNCNLRKWLKEQDLFYVTQNNAFLEPTKEHYRLARAEYVNAINYMNQICRHCQIENQK